MKLFTIVTTLLISGFASTSVHAQHHVPTAATSNYNGINSPTANSNVDLKGVATIGDEADDTARKLKLKSKLHDMLTSVLHGDEADDTARKLKLHDKLTSIKDIIEEKFGSVTAAGGGRRLSKSHKSDKGIDIEIIIEGVLLALAAIVSFILEIIFDDPRESCPGPCVEDGVAFCNFDNGDTGVCESCSLFDVVEDCSSGLGSGLPEAGKADCELRCFGERRN